jgi:RNA-binding protein
MEKLMVSKEKLRELRKESNSLEPIIRIGKNGLTPSAYSEINKLLKKRKLIKLKFLTSFVSQFEKEDSIKDIAARTDSTLVCTAGNVFVLYKQN